MIRLGSWEIYSNNRKNKEGRIRSNTHITHSQSNLSLYFIVEIYYSYLILIRSATACLSMSFSFTTPNHSKFILFPLYIYLSYFRGNTNVTDESVKKIAESLSDKKNLTTF